MLKLTKIITLLCVCSSIIILSSCAKKAPVSKKRVITVVVQKTKRGNLDKFLRLNGTLFAKDSIKVYPDMPGKVKKISQFEGKKIRKNQTIMLIDRSQVGANFKYSPVRSPVNGYVTSITVNRGQNVSPQMPVATVGNIDVLDLHINVPERWVPKIHLGQKVFFTVPAIPNKRFHSTIKRKDFTINSMSQTMLIRSTLNNYSHKLLPGMYADVEILIRSAKNVYIIPTAAIVDTENGPAVYVKRKYKKTINAQVKKSRSKLFTFKKNKGEPQKTKPTSQIIYRSKLVPVKIVFTSDTQAALQSGITKKDEIVVFGREFLTDGAEINPIYDEDKDGGK